MYFKVSVFVLLALMSYASAAPKPITFDEFSRKVQDLGRKALPAVRGACGLVNSFQGYPQNPGFPQFAGYPQAPRNYPYYPQYYPQYPQFPSVSPNSPPSPNYPPTKGQTPSIGASEQDDLNNIFSSTNFGSPQNPPPQIQDILKNFNKLPKVDSPPLKTVEGDKSADWDGSDNYVI